MVNALWTQPGKDFGIDPETYLFKIECHIP